MKYYFDDNGKLRTTSLKVTSNYIYSKNSVWRNNIGTVYNSKESAIRARIRMLSEHIKQYEKSKMELDQNIIKTIRIISFLKKQIA